MTFDICVKHWALTYALELVRRCPDVTFVLDHIGKPDIKNGLREPWFAQIRELARMPNVVVKIVRRDHRGRPSALARGRGEALSSPM